ncbi:MAG: PQQ-binding-like beta-propeller repeat protein [Bacteroidales bacterium]|nr:PQQ-binding-like beta-propeller repeat protein [Bacteroidales bacterium]
MIFDKKNIKALETIGYISGLFTLFVAVIMILGYIQLKTIKPLENPSLLNLKEMYDADPINEDLKEQVRALDLMSRRAFFASQWQIKTGTYLLIIGALIFVLSKQILIRNKKSMPAKPDDEFDLVGFNKNRRLFVMVSSASVIVLAFIVSFMLRKELPAPLPVVNETVSEGISKTIKTPEIKEIPVIPESVDTPVPIEIDKQEVIESNSPVIQAKASVSDNFPFFRGNGSRGIASSVAYPSDWNGKEGKNIKWKVKVPTHGFSSPVIWDNRIFLTGVNGIATEVMCFEKNSGELLWTSLTTGVEGEPKTPPETSEDTGLAAPTAATNGELVCAIFATGNLVCLDFEGNRIWAKNLGVPENHYGHSSSLIIHDNKLLVQYDQYKRKSIIAFDINTGDQLWETNRTVAISWASPVIATFDGITQVILTSEPSVISYDIESGRELWNVKCMSGEVGPSVGVNSKYVFAVNDFAKLVAIDPGENASIVWEDNEYTPEVASPVATEELVFVLTSWGAVACYDTETGELVWDHDFDYGFYASPIIANNLVYMLDQAGVMHIVNASKEFNIVNESPLGERTNCTPAFSDGSIYIRSEEFLYCISE